MDLKPLLLLAAAPTLAFGQQTNVEWLNLVNDPGRIRNPDGSIATQVTTDAEEKDFAVGDLDKNGWVDLVIMRKEPASYPGKRAAFLLMNDNGIFTERSMQYAGASTVPGDLGFLTPTNTRDVQLADFDLDGWLDVVTCASDLLSFGVDPKSVTHPRIYRNLGSVGGAWQGLRYEESRIPTLLTAGGIPGQPRFCAVAVGDVNMDGAPDLYLVDSDWTETGYTEVPSLDLNDKLLMNNGSGYFTDEGALRMTPTMLLSAFGTSGNIIDMNMDGRPDIVKNTTLGSPMYVSIAYSNPVSSGTFSLFQTTAFGANYNMNADDLNNDGRPDIVESDDGLDSYKYNLSTDFFGKVVWGAKKTFQFLPGSNDGGFASQITFADLDNDGWKDVVIADVDIDYALCGGRIHMYHNPGGVPGAEITLREEKETSSSSGWFGAKGLSLSDAGGGYDVAAFDIDNDGDKDLVIGRCSGTFVWINQTNYGVGLPGCNGPHYLARNGPSKVNSPGFMITCTNAPPSTVGLLLVGDVQDPVGTDVFGIGVPFFVSLASPELYVLNIYSDALGNTGAPAPIPNTPALAGRRYYASALWWWGATPPCSPSLYALSGSNGLTFVIQP